MRLVAGIWPKLWKHEFITPVHKVFPPVNTDDLRKISGTKNLSKIYEALLSDPLVSDMMPNIDPSQFGNEKGLSIQDYLVKMVNKILTILDTNNEEDIISASADGGPRSQVCASKTLRSTPIDTSRNFSAHMSGGVGRICLTVFLINFLAKSENSKHFSFFSKKTLTILGGGTIFKMFF